MRFLSSANAFNQSNRRVILFLKWLIFSTSPASLIVPVSAESTTKTKPLTSGKRRILESLKDKFNKKRMLLLSRYYPSPHDTRIPEFPQFHHCPFPNHFPGVIANSGCRFVKIFALFLAQFVQHARLSGSL